MGHNIILELQNDIISRDCDVLNALRKAHVIASKLKLLEFDKWIQWELNGYNNVKDIPVYRVVLGELKALNPYRGWIPVTITNATIAETICKQKVFDSVSALIDLYKRCDSGYVQYSIVGEALELLNQLFDFPIKTQYALMISAHRIKEVIEKVKDCLLQWTIRLDGAGVRGENMSFSREEAENAKMITASTVNHFYGNTNYMNGTIDRSSVTIGDGNNVVFNYDEYGEFLSKIKESLKQENLSQDDLDTTNEILNDIGKKIRTKKKEAIIKSALAGLKDFLINVGASVTAGLIQAKINGLLP